MMSMAASDLIPDATHEALLPHAWARPWALDDDDRLQISIHALCLESDGKKVVVDTCFGPGPLPERIKHRVNDGSFLTELTDAGFGRDDVDLVVCTHLHFDHVGWNTIEVDGQRVPTFPRARYVIARAEYEHWSSLGAEQRETTAAVTFDDAVAPLFEHGVAELVDVDHRVDDVIRLIPTHGHTPGHVSVVVESQGETALITGDCTHSPLQLVEPDWSSKADTDRAQSAGTRRKLLADYADTPVLVIGTHFNAPTAGHLVTSGDRYEFRPLFR
jgi:glyoxylase-like metal-dependent hydrolase (beta-lactamase superfamily II)